ncbi:putative transcriptional regulator [Pseudacidovorax sp. 1753]|uniref:helix-turn-helix domain-containing protein n=1 Tax=Pseudacidovorax sp. 1753 TaxID=3156419 RepID=UPI00339B410D
MRPPENLMLLRALGDEIRHQRLKAALSQEALAASAQLDRTTVARIELARVHCSVSVFVAISEALGTEASKLLQGALIRYKKELRASTRRASE